MRKNNLFLKDGVRFECQGDGKCCVSRGIYGYVYLSFNDRRRLAGHLNMSLAKFTAAFMRKVDGLYELIYTGKDCPFLKNGRCEVYSARPRQCRTWPFWPENMNEKVWQQEVVSWCPGVGKGRLYSREEIDEILAKKKSVF